jgi:peptide/nickel transport system substrate-binding protein
MTTIIALAFASCSGDKTQTSTGNTFTIGVKSDPEKLHPFFNPKNASREIFQNIFLPLADYHPVERILTPILIEELPTIVDIDDDRVAFDMIIKEDATWKDGSPITAYDYATAFKLVMHPDAQAAAWKPYLSIIKDIQIDNDNPKSFRVICDRSSMWLLETVVTFYPLQEMRFDSAHHLRKYAPAQWSDDTFLTETIAEDNDIASVIKAYYTPATYRKDIHHAGGYQLDSWETDQYVQLTKIENYWADESTPNPYLKTGMDTLLYKIIKDDNARVTLLKDGGIDMTMYIDPEQYLALEQDETMASKFSFIQYDGMRMAFLGLNTRDPELADARVRQAVAHTIDVNAILEAEANGLGQPASVLLHPSKRYYPKQPPRAYDLDKAKGLLSNAGWTDSNGNGTVDKSINGKLEELNIDFFISGSNLSKTIALLWKDSAKKVGYDINIIQKDARSYIGENVNKHDYEAAALLASFDDADDNPYSRWHSDNDVIDGKNRSGFHTEASDSLILLIKNESDAVKRQVHYEQFVDILYNEVPVIPLFAPVELIVLNNAFTGIATSKRPGYMANTFTTK